MTANFPTSLDDVSTVGDGTHPTAAEALTNVPTHSTLHQNLGDAVTKVETKIGVGDSNPATNTVLTGTGSGQSAWATVDTAMISTDAVTGAKIADNAINSEHYTDGSIDRVHLAADIIDGTKLADDAVNSEHYVDGSIDRVHLAADIVDGTKIADDSIDSEHYVDGSIDTAHLADDAVTAAKLANDAVSAGDLTGGTLASGVTASSLTSVGTLGSLTVGGDVDINGLVKVNDGSAAAPTFTFDSDEGNGMYLGATDEINFATNGAKRVAIGNELFYLENGVDFFAFPNTGSGNDAEWVATGFGNYELKRNSSLRGEKENIQDPGDELTADMIDQVEPKLWNRIHSPGIPEIGPIAEDMEAISPHLAAHGFNEDGTTFLTGINKTTYLSLLVLAVKDIRTRLAALEG